MSQLLPFRLAGLVMLPEHAVTRPDGVIELADGALYSLAPALVRLSPALSPVETVLGDLVAPQHEYDGEYVPSENWPSGVYVDAATVCHFEPPLATKEEN